MRLPTPTPSGETASSPGRMGVDGWGGTVKFHLRRGNMGLPPHPGIYFFPTSTC